MALNVANVWLVYVVACNNYKNMNGGAFDIKVVYNEVKREKMERKNLKVENIILLLQGRLHIKCLIGHCRE